MTRRYTRWGNRSSNKVVEPAMLGIALSRGPTTTTTTGRAMSYLPLSLFAALLVVPAADYQLFPGLPLSTRLSFGGFLLLVPLVVSPALRIVFARFWRRLRPAWRTSLLAVGSVALMGKLALLAAGSHAGLLACYETPAARPPTGACERAFANPFGRFGGVTRLDRAIDFGPDDWNLSFINARRFNYYPWVNGNILRDRFPFAVRWQGVVERSKPSELRVTYVGQATITLDGDSIELPSHYGPSLTVPLHLGPGRHVLAIAYRFDDGSRSGGAPPVGPWATFRIRAPAGDRHADAALMPARPPLGWRVLAHGVDGGVLLLGAMLVGFYATILVGEWWLLALVAGGAPAAYAWHLAIPTLGERPEFPVALALFLARLLASPRARVRLAAYFGGCYVAVFAMLRISPGLDTLAYRSAGDDWLSYEGFAREILESWSLRGGESVFFMQPLFRYIRFGERILFGDGDSLVAAFALGTFGWAILWTGARLWRRAPAPLRVSLPFAVVWALLLLLASSSLITAFIRAPLSEYPGWTFLLLSVPMLFVSRGREWGRGVVLIGLAFLVRTNQAVAVAGMLVIFLARAVRLRPWRAAWLAIVFTGIAALPLAHNLYYGGRWVPLTTQLSTPENLLLPPARLLTVWRDPQVREILWTQAAGIFALAPVPDSLLRVVFPALLVAWAAASLLLWAHRRCVSPTAKRLLILPALHLGVYMCFVIEIYYPRHIVAGYLAMGVVALYAIRDWAGQGDAGRETGGYARGGHPAAPSTHHG